MTADRNSSHLYPSKIYAGSDKKLLLRRARIGDKRADLGGIFAAGRGFYAADDIYAPGCNVAMASATLAGVSPPAVTN